MLFLCPCACVFCQYLDFYSFGEEMDGRGVKMDLWGYFMVGEIPLFFVYFWVVAWYNVFVIAKIKEVKTDKWQPSKADHRKKERTGAKI